MFVQSSKLAQRNGVSSDSSVTHLGQRYMQTDNKRSSYK